MEIECLEIPNDDFVPHFFAVDNIEYSHDNDGIGSYDSGGYQGYDSGNDYIALEDYDLYLISDSGKTKRGIDCGKLSKKMQEYLTEDIIKHLGE